MVIPDAKRCKRLKTALAEETGMIQATTERHLMESNDYLLKRIPESPYNNDEGEAPRKVRFSTAPIEDRGYGTIGVEGNESVTMVGRGADGSNQKFTVQGDRNGSFACNIPGQQIQAGYDVFGRTLKATAFETETVCTMDLITKEHVSDYFRMLRDDLPKRGRDAFTWELERLTIQNSYYNTSVVPGFDFRRGSFPARPVGQLDIGYLRRMFTILDAQGWTGAWEVTTSRQAFEAMRLNYKKATGIVLEGTVIDNDTHLLGVGVEVIEFAGIRFVIQNRPLRGYLQRRADGNGFDLIPVRATKTRAGTGEGIVSEINEDYFRCTTYVDGRVEELYEVGFYVDPTASTRMPFSVPQLTDQTFDKQMFNMTVSLIDGAFIDCNTDNMKFYYRMLHAFGYEALNPERMGAIIYQIAPEIISIYGRPEDCIPNNTDPVTLAGPFPMIHDDCSLSRCEDCDEDAGNGTPIEPRPGHVNADDCQVTGHGYFLFRTCGPIDTYLGTPGLLVKVDRMGGYDGIVTVDVDSANGSAVAGTDFTLVNETLTWADGEGGSKFFVVTINANGDGETEFDLNLSNPTGSATLATDEEGCINVTVEISPALSNCSPVEDINASAAARALAEANNLDLALVTGTGNGGKIIQSDVQSYLDALAPQGATVVSLTYKKDGGSLTTVTTTHSPAYDLANPGDRTAIIAALVASADIDGATLTMQATNKWKPGITFIDGHVFTLVNLVVGATSYPANHNH